MARAQASEPVEIEAIPQPAPDQGAALRSLLDIQKKRFADMPRQRVKVRNDGDVFVQVNGYSFLIKPNVPVSVPEQVAEILEEGGYI